MIVSGHSWWWWRDQSNQNERHILFIEEGRSPDAIYETILLPVIEFAAQFIAASSEIC